MTQQTNKQHAPKCGTTAAGTCFLVVYYGQGHTIQFEERVSCCAAHRPPEILALIDEAEVIELIIANGYDQAIVTDEGTRWRSNPAPGHIIAPGQPWAWTRINGLPSEFDRALRLKSAVEAPIDSGAPEGLVSASVKDSRQGP